MQGPNLSEPANYTGSYTTTRKEIVDIEIAMYQATQTMLTPRDRQLLSKLEDF
jgi:hypothetical protein